MFNWFKKKKDEHIDEKKDNIESIEKIEKDSSEKFDEDVREAVNIEAEEENTKTNDNFFKKMFHGLEKTRDNFTKKLGDVFGSYVKIDDELYDDLEEILITSDIGVKTTLSLIENLKTRIRDEKINDPNQVMPLLADEAKKLIELDENENTFTPNKVPTIILVVGVNGVGKTTTIGKLAAKYKAEGKNVLLVAADTFRAAATEQLKEWANRTNVDIISQGEGSDPASIVYDSIQAAKARHTDIILCDTAGRLHNKDNLMNELEKIYKVIDKNFEEANKESLLVVDATTGQNAIQQAKEFKEVANLTGIVITKLDGTAKGGIILPIINELRIPVVYVGVGEKVDDLQEFDGDVFINSIFNEK